MKLFSGKSKKKIKDINSYDDDSDEIESFINIDNDGDITSTQNGIKKDGSTKSVLLGFIDKIDKGLSNCISLIKLHKYIEMFLLIPFFIVSPFGLPLYVLLFTVHMCFLMDIFIYCLSVILIGI